MSGAMNYIKEVNDFEKALMLNKDRSAAIKDAIQKAYRQAWHADGPNIDQINAFVAPYIKSQEEAFFAAMTIMSNIFVVRKKHE